MEIKRYKERLKALPARPGVYLFKDGTENVLYVGKASVLRNRVRSYFTNHEDLSPKVRRLMARVKDFEFIVTDSEQEAILLECNLIKKYRPFYNIRLKDDKTYPYLTVSLNEEWPRIYMTRRLESDKARHFGPYASAASVRQTLDLIQKLFPFRSCKNSFWSKRFKPCLEYHIHRCLGPCTGEITKKEYYSVIKQVMNFLDGNDEMVIKELQRKMQEAADNTEFERAAYLRDQIRSLTLVTERQKISWVSMEDRDAIALIELKEQALVMVFAVRRGKLLGKEHFILTNTQEEKKGNIMASFLKQYYGLASYIPPLILLQFPVEETGAIEKYLQKKRAKKVRILVPQRGKNRDLVAMVEENIKQTLEQLRVKLLVEVDTVSRGLAELKEKLGLPGIPRRIEGFDISNIRGTLAVGSMVAFENGQPKKELYRRFKINTVNSIDDYAMMQELLRRRIKKYVEPQEKGWENIPDLILIDGGKGHLNAAIEVLKESGVSVPLISLAKQNEEVFQPGRAEALNMPGNSSALYLLQRVRDEAHRFALSYHGKLRQKQGIKSVLDSIPGIGPKRKKSLIRHFGSVKGIKEATVDEIASVSGMNQFLAVKIKEYI
ncbi:MAG: excinuclease ABC subunit UvrC [Dehalococcoidia bacterium]|nr:excinuclease ABC subunit UvrC [Dehalococcoidia bacterium]